MDSIKKLVSSADFIGLEPTFTYQTKSRYKTIFGGLMSIVLGSLFLSGMLYFGRELYQRRNPTIISSSTLNPLPAPMDITPQTFPFYISIQDASNNLKYFKDETIYSLKVYLRTQTRSKDKNGVATLAVNLIPITMVDCDLDYHFAGMQGLYNVTDYKNAYCIGKGQNITIQGDFPDDIFNFLQINYYQCTNTTDVSNCKSQTVIDNSIRNTYIAIDYAYYLMTPNDFDTPVKRIRQEFFTTASNAGFKQINVYLKRFFLNTDKGFIFEDVHTDAYNQVATVQELASNVAPRPGERMFNFGIRMSYQEDFISRDYVKLQTVIANVGGLFKFLSLVFEVLVIYFTKKSFFLELINQNFRINDDKARTSREKLGAEADTPEKKDPGASGLDGGVVIHNQNLSGMRSGISRQVILDNNRSSFKYEVIKDYTILNEKVRQVKAGNKLSLNIWKYLRTFYCPGSSVRYAKNKHIYDKGVKIIKKCIDINEVIYKLLEYERLKQIILDRNQLILFNSGQCPNIESLTFNSSDKTFMSGFHNESYSYKMLQESYLKLTLDNAGINKRILDIYDPNVLEFLNNN
jgi:hypothetical protein